MDPQLVEQRPRRAREVAPIIREAADRRLARVQHHLLVRAPEPVVRVLHDPRRNLPINRTTEAVHIRSYPVPPSSPSLLSFWCFLLEPGEYANRAFKRKRLAVKSVLI